MSDYPKARHNYFCENSHCNICLEDAESLDRYFSERFGTDSKDWLGHYCSFMDKRLGRSSETEFGWFDPIIFEPAHIEAFIESEEFA